METAPPLFKSHRTMIIRAVGDIIMNFNSTEQVSRELRKLGQQHLYREVEAEHFDLFGQALIMTVEQALGDTVSTEEREALEMVTTEIAKGIVSDNYLTKEWYMQIYATINLSKEEMDEILHLWKKQVFHNGAAFGQLFFKRLFSIYPELAFKFPELEGVVDFEKIL